MITEDFALILFTVAEVTEIEADEILSSNKRMEVVEARVLLAKVMRDFGYHPSLIANKMNKAKSGIIALLETFEQREKPIRFLQECIKKLSRNYLITNQLRIDYIMQY